MITHVRQGLANTGLLIAGGGHSSSCEHAYRPQPGGRALPELLEGRMCLLHPLWRLQRHRLGKGTRVPWNVGDPGLSLTLVTTLSPYVHVYKLYPKGKAM